MLIASAAGAVGAIMRYLVSGWVQETTGTDFPAGTTTVNLVGSFLLGLVIGNGSVNSALALAAVGFLGGFTTFSTWMIETIRLGPRSSRALINLILSLVGGVAAAALGFTLSN